MKHEDQIFSSVFDMVHMGVPFHIKIESDSSMLVRL